MLCKRGSFRSIDKDNHYYLFSLLSYLFLYVVYTHCSSLCTAFINYYHSIYRNNCVIMGFLRIVRLLKKSTSFLYALMSCFGKVIHSQRDKGSAKYETCCCSCRKSLPRQCRPLPVGESATIALKRTQLTHTRRCRMRHIEFLSDVFDKPIYAIFFYKCSFFLLNVRYFVVMFRSRNFLFYFLCYRNFVHVHPCVCR